MAFGQFDAGLKGHAFHARMKMHDLLIFWAYEYEEIRKHHGVKGI